MPDIGTELGFTLAGNLVDAALMTVRKRLDGAG